MIERCLLGYRLEVERFTDHMFAATLYDGLGVEICTEYGNSSQDAMREAVKHARFFRRREWYVNNPLVVIDRETYYLTSLPDWAVSYIKRLREVEWRWLCHMWRQSNG